MDAHSLSAEDIVGPDRYAAQGYPFEAWRALRREAPVRWFELGERPGFWAITRREELVLVSKQPERFQNAPRLAVFPDSPPRDRAHGPVLRHLLNMDPPDHGAYRRLASGWFTPRAIERRRSEIVRLTRERVDRLAEEPESDFVADFTAPLTLSVLADMLGVPRDDWEQLFAWSNAFAGAADPEYQAGGGAGETMDRARNAVFAYFERMVGERRRVPRDDIVSVLAQGELAGFPLPTLELLSYFALLLTAGNETTRNAASGGLLALIEHPGELAKLVREPALTARAVEEIVRWSSPVIQFCRTAVADTPLCGQRIRAGDSLCLFYASANRDEAAFADPDAFRVDRAPNPHVGFGIGEHFCLGANLARLELRTIFEELVPRIRQVELAAPPERMRSSFLGGFKRLPLRLDLVRA